MAFLRKTKDEDAYFGAPICDSRQAVPIENLPTTSRMQNEQTIPQKLIPSFPSQRFLLHYMPASTGNGSVNVYHRHVTLAHSASLPPTTYFKSTFCLQHCFVDSNLFYLRHFSTPSLKRSLRASVTATLPTQYFLHHITNNNNPDVKLQKFPQQQRY